MLSGWFQRQRDDLIRDGLLGLAILAVGAGFAAYYDQRLELRAESSENTRFVRQAVMDGAPLKPFIGLNLRGAALSGLDLGCTAPNEARAAAFAEDRSAAGCANFTGADLQGAQLNRSVLRYAELTDADLRDADLALADLGGALLGGARLRGADLTMTDLREADLRGVEMAGIDVSQACYDTTTQWPDDYAPGEVDPTSCPSGGTPITILDDGEA